MKKSFIIIFLIFITFSAIASAPMCEVKNNDFNFNYEIKGESIRYTIERKDKQDFKYFQRYYFNNKQLPVEFGFVLPNLNKNYQIKETNDKILNFYKGLYYTNALVGVPAVRDKKIELPIPKNKLVSVSKIEESLDYVEFIKPFQINENDSDFYGQNDLYFELRIVLDENLEKCLIFKTDTIKYDMGNKLLWKFRSLF